MAPEITPGRPFLAMEIPLVGGGTFQLGPDNVWTLLVVYRGRHCGRCKPYLTKLNGHLDRFRDLGVQVLAVSADPKERAEADLAKFGWNFPLGYDLSLTQMRQLGLFVSDSLSEAEPGRPFAEPGLFITNGEGVLQVIATSNSASVRPDLDVVLDGVGAMKRKGLPVRGLAA